MEPKKLLICIGADPRTSRRPAEAIRIAAGVGAWKKVRASIYLLGPAAECLTEYPEELKKGELIEQYLPAIQAHEGTIFIQKGAGARRRTDLQVTELTKETETKVFTQADYVMRFDVPASGETSASSK